MNTKLKWDFKLTSIKRHWQSDAKDAETILEGTVLVWLKFFKKF